MTAANSMPVAHWYTYPPKQCYSDCSPLSYADIPAIETDCASIYVHIPFCTMKCSFCSLFTSTGFTEDTLSRYIDHLVVECHTTQRIIPSSGKINSVYFGGGTPSILPASLIAKLAEALQTLGVSQGTPKTVEFSPDVVSQATASLWNSYGFCRASIGAQSFDDSMLASMRRRHTRSDTLLAISVLRDAGFSDINVDLIFGHSNQLISDWQRDIVTIIESEATSCTFHPLATTNKTAQDRKSLAVELAVSHVEQMHLLAISTFESAGWQRTSAISYAKSGRPNHIEQQESLGAPTIGLGAGARNYFSHLHTSTLPFSKRLPFGAILKEYFEAVSAGMKPAMSSVSLSDEEVIRRQLVLQMHHGTIHETTVARAAKSSSTQDVSAKLSDLVREGYLVRNDGVLMLSSKGAVNAASIGLLLASTAVADRIRERIAS